MRKPTAAEAMSCLPPLPQHLLVPVRILAAVGASLPGAYEALARVWERRSIGHYTSLAPQ